MIADQLAQPFSQNVGIDLGSGDITMAQHLLNATQVGTIGQKVRGEGMAQNMR